jgi:7-cyano-7-deazaguanine reductase|tara:strand:- start:990 stop:1898 length:909 start_codon:yes stop_codon:yes gene_type:complete
MSKEVVEIAGKHLGTISAYSEKYDAELLLKIPRNLNREAYDIDENNLPFVGYDVWNAYEVSAITEKGRPVTGMLKISYSCDSKYHVESKSIKLYLNSFNMHKIGATEEDCVRSIEEIASHDLSTLLECEVKCQLHRTVDYGAFSENNHIPFQGFVNIETLTDLDEIEFDTYKSDASQLEVVDSENDSLTLLHSDLLRSNCRVTNQPDWGDIYICIDGDKTITPESLAKYIVSHRQVSHFHEEICEMVFKHIYNAVKPKGLMVACLYTRRGGIDINPVRATHKSLFEPEFVSPEFINEKTLRQ